MKKHFWTTFIVVLAFILGYSINNIAISDQKSDYRVAIVDIQKLVANSNEVKMLKQDQERKISAMQTTIDKARSEISKEKDPAKIKAIEDKYMTEINQQKITLDKEYNSKLLAVDNNIRAAVIEKARSLNYDLVVPKNVILFGGDDITDQVASSVK